MFNPFKSHFKKSSYYDNEVLAVSTSRNQFLARYSYTSSFVLVYRKKTGIGRQHACWKYRHLRYIAEISADTNISPTSWSSQWSPSRRKETTGKTKT
jgi:hypothetical protein